MEKAQTSVNQIQAAFKTAEQAQKNDQNTHQKSRF